jgi:hypothetical protein
MGVALYYNNITNLNVLTTTIYWQPYNLNLKRVNLKIVKK